MRALWLGLWLLSLACLAQDNWSDAEMPHWTFGIRQVYTDPLSDSLIAIGEVTEVNDFGTPSLMTYKRGAWSTKLQPRGALRTAVRFGDTLVIAGGLWEVEGIAVSRIAAFYNNSWHPYGTFGDTLGNWGIRKLRVLNGTLYAMGGFEFVDGQLCNGIAKRENGQWVNVGDLEYIAADPILVDVIEYQGDIYACGAVSLAPDGARGIIRYDGTSWTAPGGGILGGPSGGLCMAIYQDELILGGTIHRSAGNAGHMIMRWNGEEWRGLGGHLRDQNNDTIGEARCYALLPYEDKLLVAGGFWYAGGVPASRFAIWDGNNWCGTGDEWEGYGESLTIFDDTLFMASGYEVNGLPVNRVAKWVGGAVEGVDCTTVGIEEATSQIAPVILTGPGEGIFTLRLGQAISLHFTVVDAQGRIVRTGRTDSAGEAPIDLALRSPGLYCVIVHYDKQPGKTLRMLKT